MVLIRLLFSPCTVIFNVFAAPVPTVLFGVQLYV